MRHLGKFDLTRHASAESCLLGMRKDGYSIVMLALLVSLSVVAVSQMTPVNATGVVSTFSIGVSPKIPQRARARPRRRPSTDRAYVIQDYTSHVTIDGSTGAILATINALSRNGCYIDGLREPQVLLRGRELRDGGQRSDL